jgi:pyroglutamyl-peptidase
MRRRILVTGFAAWAEHETNPSTELALAMSGLTSGDLEFVAKAPLPVEFEHAERVANDAAIALGAFAHVALGLAASSPFIRVERIGRNRSTTTVPDNTGFVACDTAILENAPDAIGTPFDTDAFVASFGASGFDARISDDAGGYVCNDLYFRALARAVRPTLFVHVPTDAMGLEGLPEALARAIAAAMPPID